MPSGKPNILVLWGDDIGISNLSCYSRGLMGYQTPNIDRIAKEGAIFTDAYGQQSCTAGRSAFITGQSPFRTGLTKVGLPGAKLGLQVEDPTIAGWLLRDEPDNAQSRGRGKGYGPPVPPAQIVEDYRRIRAADPTVGSRVARQASRSGRPEPVETVQELGNGPSRS